MEKSCCNEPNELLCKENSENKGWDLGCSCCSGHKSEEDISCGRKQENEKKFFCKENSELIKISLGGIFFVAAIILGAVAKISDGWPNDKLGWIRFVILLFAFLLTGGEILITAFKNILKGKVFDENFLMTIASLGAFAIGELPEAVAVMLFYQVGEKFQEYGVGKSRRSISALMKLRPDSVNVITSFGIQSVVPEDVAVGSLIQVNPGERIPLDGIIQNGTAFLDTSALTGESVPRKASTGDEVLSGFINTNAVLHIKTTRPVGDSAIARVLNLVEQAGSKKSITEGFITRFARVYTPIVTLIALGLAIIPPIFVPDAEWKTWVYRALIFLVVSCPCALVISVPLGFFGGIGKASKKGILVKGSCFLEALADTKILVFDKTGTLTQGVFTVTHINVANETSISKEELLAVAAHVEKHSTHPIAVSLRLAHREILGVPSDRKDDCCPDSVLTDVKEISGQGVKGLLNGKLVLAGNSRLMKEESVKGFFDEQSAANNSQKGTFVHISIDGTYAGYIVISDKIKSTAKEAILRLKKIGVKKAVMLTGDSKIVANKVAQELGIDQVFADLMPEDKVQQVERLISEKKTKGEKIVFVGDGINDAPVLARSDIGVAMGTAGSDAAIEAADVVIMTDELLKLPEAIIVAKKTRKIVKQNIVFALGIKIFVMILGAVGLTNMWAAVFADVGVSCIAVINSIKQLYGKDKKL